MTITCLENVTLARLKDPLFTLVGLFLNMIVGGLRIFAVSSTALASIVMRHFVSRSLNVEPSSPVIESAFSLFSTSSMYLIKGEVIQELEDRFNMMEYKTFNGLTSSQHRHPTIPSNIIRETAQCQSHVHINHNIITVQNYIKDSHGI